MMMTSASLSEMARMVQPRLRVMYVDMQYKQEPITCLNDLQISFPEALSHVWHWRLSSVRNKLLSSNLFESEASVGLAAFDCFLGTILQSVVLNSLGLFVAYVMLALPLSDGSSHI